MRLVLAAALVAMIATPVAAQSLAGQIRSAQNAFRLGLDDDEMMTGGYYDSLIENLEGAFIDTTPLLAVPGTDAQIEDGVKSQCAAAPITIRPAPPLAVTFTYGGVAGAATVTYTYVGGTSFSGAVDATAYLKRFGLFDRLTTARAQALFALGSVSGIKSIYRPTADMLLLDGQRDLPRILVRCAGVVPAPPTPAASDTEALATVLGKVFDDQLGASAKPGARQPFIDCAVKVFEKLSPADIKMLVDSNFNPPPDEQQRLETAYPGLQEGARACGTAATGQPTSTE